MVPAVKTKKRNKLEILKSTKDNLTIIFISKQFLSVDAVVDY